MKNITIEQLAAAFTEWERRYREEPERFLTESQKLADLTPETYGAACAPYFMKIYAEINTGGEHPAHVTLEKMDVPLGEGTQIGNFEP